jgi:hypothetical protein
MGELMKSKYNRQMNTTPNQVPILLVRNFDGVVYNTNLFFNFSSNTATPFITSSTSSSPININNKKMRGGESLTTTALQQNNSSSLSNSAFEMNSLIKKGFKWHPGFD